MIKKKKFHCNSCFSLWNRWLEKKKKKKETGNRKWKCLFLLLRLHPPHISDFLFCFCFVFIFPYLVSPSVPIVSYVVTVCLVKDRKIWSTRRRWLSSSCDFYNTMLLRRFCYFACFWNFKRSESWTIFNWNISDQLNEKRYSTWPLQLVQRKGWYSWGNLFSKRIRAIATLGLDRSRSPTVNRFFVTKPDLTRVAIPEFRS